MWTDRQRRENAVSIMRDDIRRHPVGRQLTQEAQERAAEFAADVWKGEMGAGRAAEIGIRHVTDGLLR